jgi:hypothetical protein
MTELTVQELQAIRQRVEQVGKLSDGLVRFGVFRLGVDGVLAWIPGVGELYSLAAGGFILYQGYRAGVSMKTLVTCLGLMLGRTTISAVPIAGAVAADLFTAHRWSAKLVLKEIDRKLADLGAPVARPGVWGRMWGGRRSAAASPI